MKYKILFPLPFLFIIACASCSSIHSFQWELKNISDDTDGKNIPLFQADLSENKNNLTIDNYWLFYTDKKYNSIRTDMTQLVWNVTGDVKYEISNANITSVMEQLDDEKNNEYITDFFTNGITFHNSADDSVIEDISSYYVPLKGTPKLIVNFVQNTTNPSLYDIQINFIIYLSINFYLTFSKTQTTLYFSLLSLTNYYIFFNIILDVYEE